MYRAVQMGDTWYVKKIESVESDVENIAKLLKEDRTVILTPDLDDLNYTYIDKIEEV